jgi:hypothetical protein
MARREMYEKFRCILKISEIVVNFPDAWKIF